MAQDRRSKFHPNSKEARLAVDSARRSMRFWIIGAGLVLLLAGAAVFGLTRTSQVAGAEQATTQSGAAVPDLSFDLFDGTRTSFDQFQGAPLVLNFWASWCPACVAEMPDFEKVHQQVAGDVQFLGIDTQDTSRSAADDLVRSTGVTYLLGSDPTGIIYREFGGIAMPTTVFIDASGNIVDTHSGALFADDLAARINELFFSS